MRQASKQHRMGQADEDIKAMQQKFQQELQHAHSVMDHKAMRSKRLLFFCCLFHGLPCETPGRFLMLPRMPCEILQVYICFSPRFCHESLLWTRKEKTASCVLARPIGYGSAVCHRILLDP